MTQICAYANDLSSSSLWLKHHVCNALQWFPSMACRSGLLFFSPSSAFRSSGSRNDVTEQDMKRSVGVFVVVCSSRNGSVTLKTPTPKYSFSLGQGIKNWFWLILIPLFIASFNLVFSILETSSVEGASSLDGSVKKA